MAAGIAGKKEEATEAEQLMAKAFVREKPHPWEKNRTRGNNNVSTKQPIGQQALQRLMCYPIGDS